MRLKTFLCRSMEEALSTIRTEMGPEAMIISTLNEGKKIRVTAACEKSYEKGPTFPTSPARFDALATKNLFCHLLTYHGVPAAISENMVAELCALAPAILESGIEAVLSQLLPITAFDFKNPKSIPKQLMVAGPVGVGKTVSLAKLASELCLLNKKVVIISTDYLKAGAKEQIQLYADAIKVSLKLVNSPTALEETLRTIPEDCTVLIDTPGANPLNGNDTYQLTEFILAAKQAPFFVLSAGGDAVEMQETALAFKDLGCTRMLMTRIDATKRFGGLLSILFKERLELFALSLGPEIGNRLRAASPKNIAEILHFYLPEQAESIALPLQSNVIPVMASHHNRPTYTNIPPWVKHVMEKHS